MQISTDIVGYAASGLVLLTFVMKDMRPLRVTAILSNLAFIAYGAMHALPPGPCLHFALLPLNLARLRQLQCAAGEAHAALAAGPLVLRRRGRGWSASSPWRRPPEAYRRDRRQPCRAGGIRSGAPHCTSRSTGAPSVAVSPLCGDLPLQHQMKRQAPVSDPQRRGGCLCERATWWRFEVARGTDRMTTAYSGPDISGRIRAYRPRRERRGRRGSMASSNMIAHELLLRFLDARDLPICRPG